MAQFNRAGTLDFSHYLHDGAAAVTADGGGTIATVAKVVDLGSTDTMKGAMIVDVSAIVVDTATDKYVVKLQGTNTAAFGGTDIVDLAALELGHATALPGATAKTTGTYEVPFINQSQVDGAETRFRYLRVYVDLTSSGSPAASITYKAYLTKF
jgi:hypothetical protein